MLDPPQKEEYENGDDYGNGACTNYHSNHLTRKENNVRKSAYSTN